MHCLGGCSEEKLPAIFAFSAALVSSGKLHSRHGLLLKEIQGSDILVETFAKLSHFRWWCHRPHLHHWHQSWLKPDYIHCYLNSHPFDDFRSMLSTLGSTHAFPQDLTPTKILT